VEREITLEHLMALLLLLTIKEVGKEVTLELLKAMLVLLTIKDME
jgi:hypothetical protein